MRKIVFILSALILASCGQNATSDLKDSADSNIVIKDSVSVVENQVDINPSFMVTKDLVGTDFGNFFKTLYKQGKFEDMLAFTSSQSIDQFGKEVILDFYKNNLQFGYEIGKPHSQTVTGEIITLNYDANIIATKKVVRFNVVVENDSCKIVLPNNLKDFPG
ncbi:MAG: hypothetical protein AABY15_05345 [Nanoarchaeota archaeon]